MSKYLTKNGVRDIEEYDEDQKINFFINNPNAREATDLDLRTRGDSRPNSDVEEENRKFEEEEKKLQLQKFNELKFGTYSHRHGSRTGGKGDDVSKEDFDTDYGWEQYQIWNGDIEKPIIPLDDQVSERVRSNDLDMEADSSHIYYNQENNNGFVEKFYNIQDLENMGINIKDFQGFLNRHGLSESFTTMHDVDSFEESGATVFNDATNRLRVGYQRELSNYLDAYYDDVNQRTNEKLFAEDYNNDPSKYFEFNSIEDAFEAWVKENKGGYNAFDYENYSYYGQVHFKDKLLRDNENEKLQQEYLKERVDDSNWSGTGKGILEALFTEGAIPGFFKEGISEGTTWLMDKFGFEGAAMERRFSKREKDLSDPAKAMKYMMVVGKGLTIDGKEYIIDRNQGQLYDATTGVMVGNSMDPRQKQGIIDKIEKDGVEDSWDMNLRGGTTILGNVLGNIIFQILGTKGAGSLRSLASLKSLQGLNKLRKLKGLKPINTRARGFGGKFKSTKETFGVNLKFDPRIVDAVNFQASYGAMTGYENTITQAIDAGIPYDEAMKLAQTAQTQMALLYGITGPINPRLPGLNKLDEFIAGNQIFSRAINAYKQGGKEAFRKSISNQMKRLVPNRATVSTFLDQGFRETVQENIQQSGEMLIVNRNINEQAGVEFLKQDYNLDDFIQTSILSFAAGGLIGGASVASFATPNGKRARLQDMVLLSRNLKDTKSRLNAAVDKGKLSQSDANDMYKQIKAISTAQVPAWMFNTPDELIEHAVIQAEIKELQNQLKKFDPKKQGDKVIQGIVADIDTKLLALNEIVERAAAQSIDEQVDLFTETFKVQTVVLNNDQELIDAGFSGKDFDSDGWLEKDGIIYINKDKAVKMQAVSVASHELLHKIIKSEFKNNPAIGKVVQEFKEILRSKGVLKKLNRRADLYRKLGKKDGGDIDENGKNQDEWLTMFSDALMKNEITFNELQENDWLRIGRSLIDIVKRKFGRKKYEFQSGQQVYDFILKYKENIEKGKLGAQAQRMLDSFTPDEEEDGKTRSINMEDEINQEKLDALVNPDIEFKNSKAHVVAKRLIDDGHFDKLIGAKMASGKTIHGRSRVDIIEDVREELKRHLENFDPTKQREDGGLFAYLNSYIAFKVGTVTGRAKRTLKTQSIDIDREGAQITQEIEDTGLNPEELMIAKEEALAAEKIISRLKISRQFTDDTRKEILNILLPLVRDLDAGLLDAKSINAKNSPIIKNLKKVLGNSLIFDEVIKVLGVRDKLRINLLKLKEDILANATTTWLQGRDMGDKVDGGIPQVIDKIIKLKDGTEVRVPYPEWVGQEIAREKTDTDNAGRTSGHDLVFRSEDAINLDDDIYLSQFYDAKGKLIPGRKQGVAKHIAQESGIEYILDELVNNKNGAVAQMFKNNQAAKGILNIFDKVNQFIEQSKRDGVKRSLSYDPDVAMEYMNRAIEWDLRLGKTALQDYLDHGIPDDYRWIVKIYRDNNSEIESLRFTQQVLSFSQLEGNEKVKPYVEEFLNMTPDEKKVALGEFSLNGLVEILPASFFAGFGKGEIQALLGIHDRHIDPGTKDSPSSIAQKILAKVEQGEETVPFNHADKGKNNGVKIIRAGHGFILQVQNQVIGKNFKTQKDAEEAFEEIFGEDIKTININNAAALVYILEKAQEVVANNPKLIPGYLAWFQAASNLGVGIRGLTRVQDIQIHKENQAPFVSKPDSETGEIKGYWSINKSTKVAGTKMTTLDAYKNGLIVINKAHPDHNITKEWIDKKEAEYLRRKEEGNLNKAETEKINNFLKKSREERYRDRLRPKTEHKDPASNVFGKVAVHQLSLVNTILDKELQGENITKIIQANSIRGNKGLNVILSDFTQQLNTEILSQLQDEIHGTNSALGDLRIFAIDESKAKFFYPTHGNVQALGRARKALEIEVNKYAEILSQQQAVDNHKSRSLSLEPKGISVYDFDDTLVTTESEILVSMPDGTLRRLSPVQFAKQHAKLEALGAKFDYSEFNKVVKGKPGPLAPRLKKAIDKFGNENIFILTARPQKAATAIHAFLKGIGLEIPLQNIVGLENGTPKAKADWIVKKIARGYNDFYFVDDVYKNVKAVQDVLNVFDVKGKVQQTIINRKRSLSVDLNDMIERNTSVKANATFSKVVARKKGAGKGKYTLFIPYGAEDFRGLTSYTLAGKGKQGEADQKYFEDNLVKPYARGVGAVEMARQSIKNDYRALLKTFPDIKKKLNKEAIDGFTFDQVIRVYLYTKSGHEIPGISKRDLKAMLNLVNSNKDLKQFADTLQVITKKAEWVAPEEFWDVGSILKDLNNLQDKVIRKEYLAEFNENVDIIFSETNLNKLEAIYGTNYRNALENIIGRMKSGSNRAADTSTLEGKWLTWVNNSVGTIMFFNRRSAFLQMISFANFVNWSDNNPLMAAKAFANQPLYWKTWVKIFNSDKLKQRRGGLKSDVQEQEIANAAKNAKDSPSAVISYLLKIGFTPTQIADSMAIATGGATFLINRTNTYLKQGMSQAEADAKAFEDFALISDETQQSGDPMLISSQQASHLGRLILAFQNTPMQYTRLMKKSMQDIYNGRGDFKTNFSKILYYGFVQNLIFNSLQQALFALLPEFDPDDDEEKYEKLINTKKERIINGMIDTILRGSGLSGAVLSTIKNTINKYYQQEKKGYMADHTYTLIELANISPPIGSKLRKVYSAIQTEKYNSSVIKERGLSLVAEGRLNISPAYEIIGNLLSAGFNIPLDRVVVELNSISEGLDNRNTAYQRIALLLGWRNWDVNARNEENDFIKLVYKELKAIENKKKRRTNQKRSTKRK